MVMNCPILNHPLKDGVFVENKDIVKFIQKVIVDFRPQEQICRKCYNRTVITYEDKMKRARQLNLSRLHSNSVSTVKTISIASSSQTHLSQSSNDSYDLQISKTPLHVKKKKSNLSDLNNASEDVPTSIVETTVRMSQSPSTSSAAIAALSLNGKSVASTSTSAVTTVRSRTIKDFLTPIVPKPQHKPNSKDMQNISQTNTDTISNNQQLDSRMITTNAAPAASANISTSQDVEVDSDDDNPRMSLNYYNGTRLPHVQPIPPRRKPKLNDAGPSIMDKYIKDITGG